MRRWPTWLVVGALVALAAVAAADALRGDGRVIVQTQPAAPGLPSLRQAGLRGFLYFTDGSCRLRAVELPSLRRVQAPEGRGCGFSMSPAGVELADARAVWEPQGGLYATDIDGGIRVGSPASEHTLVVSGHTPAFKADGTFTYVRDGAVVEWTPVCPPHARLFTLPADNATARCRRVLVSSRELARAGRADRNVPAGAALSVRQTAWLGTDRLVAVLEFRLGAIREELVALFVRGRPAAVIPGLGRTFESLSVSPKDDRVAIRDSAGAVPVLDASGAVTPLVTLQAVRAVAWSPDARWIAVATRASVFILRTSGAETRIRRLPFAARALAWR